MKNKKNSLPFAVAVSAFVLSALGVVAFADEPDASSNAAAGTLRWGRVADFARPSTTPPKQPLASEAQTPVPATVAWRGENVHFRIGVWSSARVPAVLEAPATLIFKNEATGAEFSAKIHAISEAVGDDDFRTADIVRDDSRLAVSAGTHGEWLVSADIPQDATPGLYTGTLAAPANAPQEDGAPLPPLNFSIEVLPNVLPVARERKIHLDLWQHPEAVARWCGVKLWSKEHFDALVPAMTRLRDLGQKVITCSIIEEPWSHQTFDDWSSMVKWRRERDDSWAFDYAAFDAWVDFMMNTIGIDEQISCYSMLPWSMKIRYFDVATQSSRELKLNTKTFEPTWGAFLTDFKKHLIQKGWLEKTCIALDERQDAQLFAAVRALKKFAPELKIVSAHNTPSKSSDFVYDISPAFRHSGGNVSELAVKRRAEGKKTTFYVCVFPDRPNTFTHSAPAEAHWLGFYAAANNFDGFLRWAYNSWNKNPFETTSFGKWPDGDCFLIYPPNLSSMRLERLRDGLEDFEKIQILRSRAAGPATPAELKSAVAELDAYLRSEFTLAKGGENAHEAQVLRARELLNAASRATSGE